MPRKSGIACARVIRAVSTPRELSRAAPQQLQSGAPAADSRQSPTPPTCDVRSRLIHGEANPVSIAALPR